MASVTYIEQSSPLDTLVRKTSSRGRSKPTPQVTISPPVTPSRSDAGSLDSPLLHTRFRSSNTTFASSANESYDTSGDGRSLLSYDSPYDPHMVPHAGVQVNHYDPGQFLS